MFETLDLLLRMALAEPAVPAPPTAFVLPTTRRVLDSLSLAARAGRVLLAGVEAGAATTPATILGRLRTGARPRALVVFEDQLSGPADATLMVRLPDGDIHVSPFGFILADAYGYRLAVWGHDRNRIFDGPQPIETLAAATVSHLESCRHLGVAWSRRDLQAQRGTASRRMTAMRKIRYLRSCVADAFMARPDSAECRDLMARIASLEERVAQVAAS